jgi:branched-chain amino acid transport system permease protein
MTKNAARSVWPGYGRLVVGAVAVAAVFSVPLVAGEYVRFVLLMVLINVIATTGVNLSMGYCGLVSVGHAGFVAIGAYVTTLLMVQWNVPFPVSLAAGTVAAGIAGVVIGLPALRLSPLYIAMVTFGFGQAVNYVALNWIELTGGPNGMAVPPPTLFDDILSNGAIYAMTAGFCLLTLWVAWNIARSRLGRAFIAIRESEIAAQSMGVKVATYKTIAFGIGALFGGLAGGLYAFASGYVNPDAFVFLVSIMYVTMCVAGGLGTVLGPVIGGILLTLLPELLRPLAEYKEVLSGIVLLAFLVLMPRGLGPLIGAAIGRMTERLARPAQPREPDTA